LTGRRSLGAGLVYGHGESARQLAPLWQQAWEGEPLCIYGSGGNRLPLVHVSELAAFVEAVAVGPAPAKPYLLVAEQPGCTQVRSAGGCSVGWHAAQCCRHTTCFPLPSRGIEERAGSAR
jgi:nucleoside-diphosphate-sugar epimerase